MHCFNTLVWVCECVVCAQTATYLPECTFQSRGTYVAKKYHIIILEWLIQKHPNDRQIIIFYVVRFQIVKLALVQGHQSSLVVRVHLTIASNEKQ